MMVALDSRHECGIAPEEQTATVTKDGAALVARYGKLRHAGAEHDVSIELRFTLEGDGIACEAQLENRSEFVIEEFWFPWVGPFRSLSDQPTNDMLILPDGFGRRVRNPAAYVAQKHTGYIAPDQKRVLACSFYPGGSITMGWFGFYGGGKALGLMSLDDSFQTTGLNIARDTRTTMLSAGFARYPFLKRGTWSSPRSLVRLHRGDWHDDPYLCFDPSHPHAGPALAQGPGKNATLAALRKALIEGHAGRAFGTEHVTDCLDRHVDFVHSATFGVSPAAEAAPEVFRYTFPGILCSSREIRDETDHERRMNWAFVFGWRFDVEIWRCRGDLRHAPAYGAYMAKLNALRDRWPDLLMTGRFVDEEFFERDRQAFIAKGYTVGQRAAIVAWNITSHEHRFMPKLREKRRFIEGATVNGPFRPGDMLPAHSVGVLVYE